MKQEITIGDNILIEQAWEDEAGNYHDEYADVESIDDKGNMTLKFINVSPEVEEFLDGCVFNVKDYQ